MCCAIVTLQHQQILLQALQPPLGDSSWRRRAGVGVGVRGGCGGYAIRFCRVHVIRALLRVVGTGTC